MPVFLEISPDAFATEFRNLAQGDPQEGGLEPGFARHRPLRNFAHVRRPVRGIQIKDDTYATIQIRTADGRTISLVDSGGTPDPDNPAVAYSSAYSNFLLQRVQEVRAEKAQVVETFGEPFIFLFGERPRVIQGSGILLNTEDFNWRAEWWENYDKYLRGTRCVQTKTRATLAWDDVVVEGYFLKADAVESAQEQNFVRLNFEFFLTNYQNVSAIGAAEFPRISAEVHLNPNDLDTTGEGIGTLVSSTQLVRELNLQSQSFETKNSLLQTLREEVTAAVTLDGRLRSLLELASQASSGRAVRVPLGVAGGAVFDADVQLALASVPISQRRVVLQSRLGNQPFALRGLLAMASKSMRATYGKISLNEDEYIARAQVSGGQPARPPDLFADQKVRESEVEAQVRSVLATFGVPLDEPPDAALLAARRAAFGVFAIGIGIAAQDVDGLASLRQFSNAVL